jgi:hypothetical protein
MGEGGESDKLWIHPTPAAPRQANLPDGRRSDGPGRMLLDPNLVKKVGAIRRFGNWVIRDLSSFMVGLLVAILVAGLAVAIGILEQPVPVVRDSSQLYKLLPLAIGVVCVGVFTGFCLILARFVIEHVNCFRRWQVAYAVVFLVWVALWGTGWWGITHEEEKSDLPPYAMFCFLGFFTLPFAALLACIPLTALGAIASFFTWCKKRGTNEMTYREIPK